MWRCLNRIENGKRICKHSPTFAETDIHDAIIAAMNEMFIQQTAREVLKNSITAALAAVEPELTIPAVESQIQALQARRVELYKLASLPDAGEEYDEEIGRIHGSKMRLLQIKAELEMAQQTSTEFDCRMDAITTALAEDSGTIEEYNDTRTRQLISNIKVLDKEQLLVRFRDGTEIVQHIQKKDAVVMIHITTRHNSVRGISKALQRKAFRKIVVLTTYSIEKPRDSKDSRGFQIIDKPTSLSLRGAQRRGNPHPPSSRTPLPEDEGRGLTR